MDTLAHFHWLDYVVFICIILISISIGIFHGIRTRQNKSSISFFLGDREMKWLPVGLSILVTFQSAILYLGIPAEIYTHGTSYFLFHIGMGLSVVICCTLFVPLLFPLKLTSVYEYLERRFHSRAARVIGSLLGMINMMLYMGVVIFAPATAMEAASGFPVWASIILIGFVAICYTALGGMRAVVWTDVFQFVIMCSGLLAMLIQGCISLGGIQKVWEINRESHRIDFSSFNPDPRVRHTVWGLIIGSTFTWLANIGVNQANVQRFSSVPTLAAAKGAVLMSLPGFVILGLLASLLGLVVYAYFAQIGCDPLQAEFISNPNQLVPLFVSKVLGFLPGFLGLFIASLFSASLSTVSSSINSLAAMAWEDFLKEYRSLEKSAHVVLKVLVALFGVLAMCVAFISMQLGGPATQIALSFFGASGGPLLGMYLLGCLFPWANAKGVCISAPIAVTLCLWLAIGGYTIPRSSVLPSAPSENCPTNGHNASTALQEPTEMNPLEEFYRISYLWYSPIGIFMTVSLGLVISFITGPEKRENIDPSLIVPVCDNICCCLPDSVRRRFRCGVGGYAPPTLSDPSQRQKEVEGVLNGGSCSNGDLKKMPAETYV